MLSFLLCFLGLALFTTHAFAPEEGACASATKFGDFLPKYANLDNALDDQKKPTTVPYITQTYNTDTIFPRKHEKFYRNVTLPTSKENFGPSSKMKDAHTKTTLTRKQLQNILDKRNRTFLKLTQKVKFSDQIYKIYHSAHELNPIIKYSTISLILRYSSEIFNVTLSISTSIILKYFVLQLLKITLMFKMKFLTLSQFCEDSKTMKNTEKLLGGRKDETIQICEIDETNEEINAEKKSTAT